MSKGIILDLCGGTGAWSLPYKANSKVEEYLKKEEQPHPKDSKEGK